MATGPGLVLRRRACPRSATPARWPAPACASQATPRWATDLSRAGRALPGSLRAWQPRANGVLRVALLDGISEAGRAELFDWVERHGEAESNYWQGFTSKQALLGSCPPPAAAASATAHRLGRRRHGHGRGPATTSTAAACSTTGCWSTSGSTPAMPFIRAGTWFMEARRPTSTDHPRRAGWKSRKRCWREWVDNMAARRAGLSVAWPTRRPGRTIGARHLHAAGRHSHPPRQQRRERPRGTAWRALWSGSRRLQRAGVADYAAHCDRATGTAAMSTLVDRHIRTGRPVDLAPSGRAWHLGRRRPHRSRRRRARGAMAQDDRAGQSSAKRVKLPWES